MKLSVHHVGGRNGTIPPIIKWRAFWPIIDATLYEADGPAAAQALEVWRNTKNGCASVTITPRCLGEAEGVSDFYICFDGSASGMLPLDPACSEYCFFTDVRGKGVYKLGDMKKADVIKLKVWPLSYLIKSGEVVKPDVLSIDAEGAGLQILRGVGDDNFENIVCLFVEASLIPIHKGEAPLHETLKFLSDRGFLCMDLGQIARYSMAEMHIGAFDRGPHSYIEDALFLRNPATVDSPQVLEKLALVAIMTGALSIAYECFKKLEAIVDQLEWREPSSNIALNCLHDFYKTWWWYKAEKLPKFNETFTKEINNFKQYTFDEPPKEVADRWKANYLRKIPKYIEALKNYKSYTEDVPTHDVLFEKYGLLDLAEQAKQERLKQVEFLEKVLSRLVMTPVEK